MPGPLEAQALVKADGGGVVGIHARDHHVLAERAARGNNALHQARADAAAAAVGAHVHRVLDREAIARPARKSPKLAKPATPCASRATSTG